MQEVLTCFFSMKGIVKMNPIQEQRAKQSVRFSNRTSNISYAEAVKTTVLFLTALLFLASGAWARPTTEDQARNVAANWLSLEAKPMGSALGHEIKSVQTFTDEFGEPTYYVVHLVPSGLIFLPADDLVEPIIGFAADATSYDPSRSNPLGALVSGDIPKRVAYVRGKAAALQSGETFAAGSPMALAQGKWARLSAPFGEGTLSSGVSSPPDSVSDVRVAPFIKSMWGQTCECGEDLPCSSGCPDIYNYYTPPNKAGDNHNYWSGCAATAMGQIMRYWKYPSVGIGVQSEQYSVNSGPQLTGKTLGGNGKGGPYDWSNMPLTPSLPPAPTVEQREAIGRLIWDIALAIGSDFTSDGTGSGGDGQVSAFLNVFKYGNAIFGTNPGNNSNIPETDLMKMLNPNLHAKYPVIIGVTGSDGGHAVVCDGYGYNNSTIYHHVNLGWVGGGNGWYNLPWMGGFTVVNGCVYNIYRSGTGEMIGGRVTDAGGNPMPNATVKAQSVVNSYSTTTDANGLFAFARVPSIMIYNITVTAYQNGFTFPSSKVTTGISIGDSATTGNVWMQDIKAKQFITKTSVGSSKNPSYWGEVVTFTATVTSTSGTPSGKVQFLVDGTNFGNSVSLSGGSATMQISSLQAGNHAVRAVYLGDAKHGTSSGLLSGGQTVDKQQTDTMVDSSGDPSYYGDTVTFTAEVNDRDDTIAGGTAQFIIDGNSFGAPVQLSGGNATLQISSLQAGNHTVSAHYNGDANHLSSSGDLRGGQTVLMTQTDTRVSSSAAPSTFGETVTLTASVSDRAGDAPGGRVQFVIDEQEFTPVILSGGNATMQIASLSVGDHTVTAAYGGDVNHQPSSGELRDGQTVNKATSTITVNSTQNPSYLGTYVTFTANVSGPGGYPTGTVQFQVDGNDLDGPQQITKESFLGHWLNFANSPATSSLSLGSHTITAIYGGDINYNANSNTMTQVVRLRLTGVTDGAGEGPK
jgi:hypothetical protein